MEEGRIVSNDAQCTMYYIAGGIFVATAGVVAYRWMRKRGSKDSEGEYPSDTVILHQIGRGPFAPSLTPFAVKLETYLRMAKLPYKNVHSRQKSSKGKFPWITYNGQSVADSAFCIEFLNKTRKIDLNAWMSREQRAVAVAFQRLAEDDLYWVLVTERWVNSVDFDFLRMSIKIPKLVFKFLVLPTIKKMTHAQGMGRHKHSDVLHIASKDLTALSDHLGTKKYLMGDQPCEEDCAIFGQLSQMYWQLPGPASVLFKEDYPRLVAYCERMKEAFWPDWVECTTQGGTSKATK